MRAKKRTVFGWTSLALTCLCIAGSANAAFVRGFIDPAFDADGTVLNTHLGWSATVIVDVPSACLDTDTNIGCAGTVSSAVGELYDTHGTDTRSDDTHLRDLNFLETPFPTPFDVTVFANEGAVTGMASSPIGYATVPAGDPALGFTGFLWVQFFAPQFDSEISLAAVGPGDEYAQLIAQLCDPIFTDFSRPSHEWDCEPAADCDPDPSSGLRSVAAAVDLSVIPEPGALALVMAGLLAAGVARRRKI